MKERTKKKMSLKSRKDKGFGKVVEDEAAVLREVDTYREDAGKTFLTDLFLVCPIVKKLDLLQQNRVFPF